MSTFGLVHGSFTSSACWEPLVPELQSRGRSVLTVDLPITDPTADAARYVDTATESFADRTSW